MSGKIYDLGYQRYAGPRRPPRHRWRVIARNQVASAWKTWWRYKGALSTAVITTVVCGGVMIMLKDNMVSNAFGRFAAKFSDTVIPRSTEWFSRAAFLASITIGARVVSADVQSGAFVFYFSRSTRPRDYIFGKLMGLCALFGLLCLAGPVVLAVTRFGLASDSNELVELFPLIPKALAIGTLSTLAFATVPMMFSTFLRSARAATMIWVGYYVVLGGIVSGIGYATQSGIGALDLATSLEAVSLKLFDLQLFRGRAGYLDWHYALASVLAHIGIAITVIIVQVRRLYGSGVGGAT